MSSSHQLTDISPDNPGGQQSDTSSVSAQKKTKKGKLLIGLFVFACLIVAIGLGIYFGVRQNNSDDDAYEEVITTEPPVTLPLVMLDCLPGINDTTENCKNRSCIWRDNVPDEDKSPRCVLPQDQSTPVGYTLMSAPTETTWGYRLALKRSDTPVLFGGAVQHVVLDVDFETEDRIRLKFYDGSKQRFEVPDDALKIERPATPPHRNLTNYELSWTNDTMFGVKIKRRDTDVVIFDTAVAGFAFEDQFLQMTVLLPSDGVYGFGEHNHRQLRHDMNYRRWSIFTRDVAPVDDWNLYGAHPFFMNLEDNGNASGVFLKNSNAMDVITLPSPPGIQYRVIGGVLDFYIFTGPSPAEVIRQYTQAIGRPVMPPYWSLGFQLSRWDYDNLTHVKDVMQRNRDAGIPQDVQVIDIDYMKNFYIFTIDDEKYSGFAEFVDELHANGQRMYVIMDPGIGNNQTIIDSIGGYPAHADGLKREVYVRTPDGSGFLENEVWPGLTLMPDFTNPNTTDWWRDWLLDFHDNKSIEYDAVWVDMNEPASFVPGSTSGCSNNSLNYPPYFPRVLEDGEQLGRLYTKTLCMDARQHWGLHYDVHSLYGHSMAMSTYKALHELWPQKRPLVLTRSSFPGTGRYAVHWLGDNQSQWRQIPWSIVGLLEFSMFGFSFVGADICGFWYATTEEMCTRWMQLGAFYPFARNHNAVNWRSQDPAAFSDEMIRSSRDILLTRYRLLPFLYTLMHNAHVEGDTVSRPLFFEFPADNMTWTIDRQFLWGPSLLISPALEKGQREVEAYFPEGTWFDYYTGEKITGPVTVNLPTPLDRINLHLRGGHIFPVQAPANTTHFSRRNAMGLLVAMGGEGATGSLFWDDGETFDTFEAKNYTHVDFKATRRALTTTPMHIGYPTSLSFDHVDVYGMDTKPAYVTVDAVQLGADKMEWRDSSKRMILTVDLKLATKHTIEWSYHK